jgi:hypothetical protein
LEGEDGREQTADGEVKSRLARALASLQWIFRRDAYVFLCTLFALAGQLRIMVWLFALGTTATWMSFVLYRWLGPRPVAMSERP